MEEQRTTVSWQPLMAALGHDDTRHVFAQLVLGLPPTLGDTAHAIRRVERSVQVLERAGLLDPERRVTGEAFKRALAAAAPPKREGVDRFLRGGRIVHYPSNPEERGVLLRRVAAAVLLPDEVIQERVMNERLATFHDDVAALRRYLVDAGLVERTRSGSEYALVP